MKTVLSIGAALLAAGAVSAHAQTGGGATRDSLFQVSPVVVDAVRPAATAGGASALHLPMHVLRRTPAPTLERAVRELPFVHVRTNARGEAYFGMRGSGQEAREVAVLLDGLPLSLGFDHRADLALLPMTGVRSLTLVRGLPSLLYGPNVLGGVVEISLSDPAGDVNAMRASAGADHTGASAAAASAGLPVRLGSGTLALRAGGGHRTSDGFPLPAGVDNVGADTDRIRTNSDHRLTDAFLAVRYGRDGRPGWLVASASGYSAERGAPPELGVTNPRFWRYPEVRRVMAMVSGGTGPATSPVGGSAEARVSLGYDVGRSELQGFTDASYATVVDREDADDRNLTGRIFASQSLGRRGRVSAAATFADVRRDEVLTPGAAAAYGQRLWSGALETEWRLPAPGLASLAATLGGAWDAADTPRTGDKPAVEPLSTWGARVGLVGASRDGRLLLHAGASRRARFPSLRELYSGALNRVEPNPELGPEFLRALEAGLTARLGASQVQLVGFHHIIDDAIVRTTVNRRVKRVNRDETRSTGAELLAAHGLGRATLTVDLTAQSVTVRDPLVGADLTAEYQPKLAGGAALAVALPFELGLHAAARATGSQYCLETGGTARRLAPVGTGSVTLSRAWRAVEAVVGVDNVTDAAAWDQCGLPRPGRVLRMAVSVR